jgi:hypothetical protein
MEYWQKEIKQRLERFNHGDGKGLALSVKVRVKSNCFCYDHSGRFHQMMDRDRRGEREGTSHWEYEEHESGPEWLLYLALTAAGLGIAEKTLGIVKSVVDLVALSVKSHREERRKRRQTPEPLIIVVRGFDPEGAFFENPVMEIGDDPPRDEAIKDSLAAVIQQIAEERVRQGKSQEGKDQPC